MDLLIIGTPGDRRLIQIEVGAMALVPGVTMPQGCGQIWHVPGFLSGPDRVVGRVLATEGTHWDAAAAVLSDAQAGRDRDYALGRLRDRAQAAEFEARCADALAGHIEEGGPEWEALMDARWLARPPYLPGARHGDPRPAYVSH